MDKKPSRRLRVNKLKVRNRDRQASFRKRHASEKKQVNFFMSYQFVDALDELSKLTGIEKNRIVEELIIKKHKSLLTKIKKACEKGLSPSQIAQDQDLDEEIIAGMFEIVDSNISVEQSSTKGMLRGDSVSNTPRRRREPIKG